MKKQITEKWRKEKKYYLKSRAKRIVYWKKWRETLKRETLSQYGELSCVRCGEDELVSLTLDHVNDDGGAHRKTVTKKKHGGGGVQFYAWLKRNGFPKTPKMQVLCMNCNHKKRYGKL